MADNREQTTDPTDEQCQAAIAAMSPDRIQGFTYGFQHVIRDVCRPYAEQEIWRGTDHGEMMARCQVERMRLALRAAKEAGL